MEEPVDQWVPTLRKRLTGKALATFREICPTAESSFSAVKADMLKRMGATVESARNVIWLQKQNQKTIWRHTPRS